MTHLNKTFFICGTAILVACSALYIKQQQDHAASLTAHESLSLLSPEQQVDMGLLHPDARIASSRSGNYLAGMIASIRGDHEYAARYLSAVVNYGDAHEPLVALTLRHKVLAGDMNGAMVLTREEYKLSHMSRMVTLLSFCDALKKEQNDEARTHLQQMSGAGLHQLFAPFLREWVSYAQNPKQYKVPPSPKTLDHAYFVSLTAHQRALIYQLQGDTTHAAEAYEQALGQMHDVSDSVMFSALRFYHQQGNKQRARTLLEDYRRIHPRTALWNLAPLETYVEGIATLRASNVTTPAEGVAEALLGVGALLVREGAHDEGQILLRLANYLRPDDLITQITLGESLEDAERFHDALAVYNSIDTPAFMHPMITMVKARVYHANDESDRARELLTELATQVKDTGASYNVQVMLGDLERVAQHYAPAAEHYSQALQAMGTPQKTDWPLLYRRGVMYDMAQAWDKAEADFDAALKLAPNEPEIMNYLAYSWLLRNQRLPEAEEMLRKAVQASPNDAHIKDSYGWALYKLGKYDEALAQLEEALMHIPSDSTINDHYGDVLWRLGRVTEARYHWQRALLFNPTEQGAKEALHVKLKDGLIHTQSTTIHTSDAENTH